MRRRISDGKEQLHAHRVYHDQRRGWAGLIYITSGEYLSNGRVSNFFTWRRVNEDGTLSKREYSGYGWRAKPAKGVKVEIRVVPKRRKKTA
jgi:hypothetical protein